MATKVIDDSPDAILRDLESLESSFDEHDLDEATKAKLVRRVEEMKRRVGASVAGVATKVHPGHVALLD